MTYPFLERFTTRNSRSGLSSRSLSASEYSRLSRRVVRRALLVLAFAVALILALLFRAV